MILDPKSPRTGFGLGVTGYANAGTGCDNFVGSECALRQCEVRSITEVEIIEAVVDG